MNIERRTPQNTAVVLVDPMTVYADLFRSQSIEENVSGTVALVKTALGFGLPLVVTATSANSPRGALYPRVAEALGDHPVVRRGRWFDAFDDAGFEDAIRRTGVKHLVIAGLMTEGCVLYTALGALRRDYTVSLVVDASAGESEVQHHAATTRLTQLGVTPVTWFSFATELQRSHHNIETVDAYYDVMSQAPLFANASAAQPTHYDLMDQPKAILETRLAHDVHRRATGLLAEAAARPGTPAPALGEVRDFLVTTLRHHHTTQDERLWPLIAAHEPATGDRLISLTREHDRLEEALAALERAETGAGARDDLAAAAADVRDLVHLHLRHEEQVLFPALRSHVTAEDWKEFADQAREDDTTAEAHLMVGFLDLVATPQEADLFFTDRPASEREQQVPAMRKKARATLGLLMPQD